MRRRSEGSPATGRTTIALGAPFRLSGLSLVLSRLSPFCQTGEGLLIQGAGFQIIIAALDLPESLRIFRRWRLPLPDQKNRSPVPEIFGSVTDDNQAKRRVREVAPLAAVSRPERKRPSERGSGTSALLTRPLTRRGFVSGSALSGDGDATDVLDPVRPVAGDAVWLVPEKASSGGSVVAVENRGAGALTKKPPTCRTGVNLDTGDRFALVKKSSRRCYNLKRAV